MRLRLLALTTAAVTGTLGCDRAANEKPPQQVAAATQPVMEKRGSQPADSTVVEEQAASSRPGGNWLADPAAREQFLRSRVRFTQTLGSFDAMASWWYATMNVLVSCKTEELARVRLTSPFPDFYKPTWAEYFDAIARQTGTSWAYQDSKFGFMFQEPGLPTPFALDLAEGWQGENRGEYVAFFPPQAPVGMDVYMLGRYSADGADAQRELFTRVRAELAARSIEMAVPQPRPDMTIEPVGGADALFCSGQNPESRVLWRQWVFVLDGSAYAIVSAIKPEHDAELWPAVQAMVRSFRSVAAGNPAAGSADPK